MSIELYVYTEQANEFCKTLIFKAHVCICVCLHVRARACARARVCL